MLVRLFVALNLMKMKPVLFVLAVVEFYELHFDVVEEQYLVLVLGQVLVYS